MADYKPGDLLVGIVDFFAILLPGAMLAFVGLKFEKEVFNGSILPLLGEGPPRWIAFALASYVIGNIVYLIGASILDPIYGTTYRRYKSRQTGDLLYHRVKELKQAALLYHDQMENAFKWSRATVRIKNAAAASEIDRLEATSKFFRSLVIVLFLTLFFLTIGRSFWPLLLSVAILLASYIRYSDLNVSELQAKGYVPPSNLFLHIEQMVRKLQSIKPLTGVTLIAACLTLAGMAYWKNAEWLSMAICLGMLYLSYWCYAIQRWKMTQTAYLYFVLFTYLPDDQKKKEDKSSREGE